VWLIGSSKKCQNLVVLTRKIISPASRNFALPAARSPRGGLDTLSLLTSEHAIIGTGGTSVHLAKKSSVESAGVVAVHGQQHRH
jgi:hypothetical protein